MESAKKTLSDKIHSLEVELRMWQNQPLPADRVIKVVRQEIEEHKRALFVINNNPKL